MRKTLLIILFFSITVTSNTATATDATGIMRIVGKSGGWKVIEFTAPTQLLFRVAATSVNFPGDNMVFDFSPNRKCEPSPALMVYKLDSYNPALDNGYIPLNYKLPGQDESAELVHTQMQRGDGFAFFPFKSLTANLLLHSASKGTLAIWVPGSGDGSVQRSNNIYFPLDGFSIAYKKAIEFCNSNR